jgi:type 1 glutamine amidotransferase
MSRRLCWAGLLLAAVALPGLSSAGDKRAPGKIRVVIIDGQNNHNWVATTPVMKKELEECGRFSVDVATSPAIPNLQKPQKPQKPKDESDEKAVAKYQKALAGYEASLPKYEAALPKFKEDLKVAQQAFAHWQIDFDNYDVVVSNYNGQPWPKSINDALESRLKAGKIGLVIVHAANNAFGGWKEYNQMIGMGWRGPSGGARLYFDDDGKPVKVPAGKGGSSNHAYTGPFTVNIRDESHPITKGMPREWLHNNDELYDNMRGPIENVHILATAYSKGTKVNEPMIWTVSYGKGRVFHTPMGHDANAMRCVGFASTLERGTEWAATGAVTLPLPPNFPTDKKISTTK